MLLYLSLSGILLSLIIFVRGARLNRSSVYLTGFFFLVSLYSFIIYSLFYSKSAFLISIVFINSTSILYLIGPMIYWYTRSILTDKYRLRKIDALHLIPAIVFLITSLPYIFSPYHEKLRIAEELVRNAEFMGSYKATVLYSLLPAEVIFLSRSVLVIVYTLVSIRMLFRYLKAGKTDLVFTGQRYMTRWLLVLLGLLLILAISHTFFVLEVVTQKTLRLFYTMNLMQIISAIGLAGLMIAPHFHPSILYGLPLLSTAPVNTQEKEIEIKEDGSETNKMKGHAFETEYLEQIESIIESSMRELKPYLKKDFSLIHLSVLIDIPIHHVSYYFREHLKQSFHDYRNWWRIEHSKMLILEGKAKELKLEAIGTLSGFSSRNTFFIAFKRAEGISPSDFASRINSNL
jgi:AraC-like DNA-binding protein